MKPELLGKLPIKLPEIALKALFTPKAKLAAAKRIEALREEVKKSIFGEASRDKTHFSISQAFDYVQKKAFRKSILEKQKRMDGRGYQDLRTITGEAGVIPRTHGSAIFQRGETQALALATLAPIEEAQNIDAYGGGGKRRSALSFITISRRSASVKPAGPAARVGVR